jgi:hypothetical protein
MNQNSINETLDTRARVAIRPSAISAARVVLAATLVPGAIAFWYNLASGVDLLGKVFARMDPDWPSPIATPWPVDLASAAAFFTGNGYLPFMTIVKLVTTAAAALLLANRAVPLALTMLAPISVGLVLGHWWVIPQLFRSSPVVALDAVWVGVLLFCQAVLVVYHWPQLRVLLQR